MDPAKQAVIEEVSLRTRNLVSFSPKTLIVLLSTLALVFVGRPSSQISASDCVRLSEDAAKRVDAVLQKRLESRDNPHTSPAATELGILLFELRSSAGPVADESLCALLNFYLGEANDGDVAYQISARGQRLIPLLDAYRGSLPCTATRFKPLVHDEETRTMLLDLVVSAIKNGESVGAE